MSEHEHLKELLENDKVKRSLSGFDWRDTDAVFRGRLPSSEWVIPDLQWGPGRPSGVWGYGGSGKSYVAAAAALAVAAGVPAFGRYPVAQGNVDFLSYEMGFAASATRLRRLGEGMSLDVEALVADGRIRLCDMPDIYLNSDGVADVLAREFEGRDLCIVDSLRRATPGEDENSSSMSNYLDILTKTSNRTGTTFVLIHHSGKGGREDARESGRGSSAILDGSGSVHLIEAPGGAGQRTLKHVRAHESGSGTGEDMVVQWDCPGPGGPVNISLLTVEEMGKVADQQRIEQAERRIRAQRKYAKDVATERPGIHFTEYMQTLKEGGLTKEAAKLAVDWLVDNERIELREVGDKTEVYACE